MDESEVQFNETVLNNVVGDHDIGQLILEELKAFRKEMREEVKKLQENVHNFLFSKADIVNALLGSSGLFSEIDRSFDAAVMEESKSTVETQPTLKQADDSRRTIIKFQPTTVEVIKPQHSSGKQQSTTTSNSLIKSSKSEVDGEKKAPLPLEVATSTNTKMAKIVNDFVSYKKPDDAKPKKQMEVQVLQYNGASDEDGDLSKSGYVSERKFTLQKRFPITKEFKVKHVSNKVLSTLPLQHKTLVLPHHSVPKISSKYTQYIGKLKGYRSSHNERKFPPKPKNKCLFCDRLFVSSNDLKRHIRVHTGDRPFQCSECPKAYTRNDHLRRHIKQKHSFVSENDEASLDLPAT